MFLGELSNALCAFLLRGECCSSRRDENGRVVERDKFDSIKTRV